MLELVIVISVIVMLTGLMMPAMVKMRESAHRVFCAANMRSLGVGVITYAADHNEYLPTSAYAYFGGWQPEMMSLYRDASLGNVAPGWEGLGHLYAQGYCDAPECFYCPSHHNTHFLEEYQPSFRMPGGQEIYSNYHYVGHVDPQDTSRRLRLTDGHLLVIATDGMRTVRDFNHDVGMNVLRGDGAVGWYYDTNKQIYELLPGEVETPRVDERETIDDTFRLIWELIYKLP